MIAGLLSEAEDLARAVTDPDRQAEPMSALARAAAATGEFDRAEDQRDQHVAVPAALTA